MFILSLLRRLFTQVCSIAVFAMNTTDHIVGNGPCVEPLPEVSSTSGILKNIPCEFCLLCQANTENIINYSQEVRYYV